jgi:5-bromo-4-chloroindolyl phosphate hydrolysis protein
MLAGMSRDERGAQNEAAARRINEQLEDAHDETPSPRYARIVCECGQAACEEVIAITPEEYEQVRSNPRQFVVARQHVVADVERVVDETDRFAVVTKRGGTPAEVAVEEDPRV